MDREHFGSWNDVVPPCDSAATVEVLSYHLCADCADALDDLAAFGSSILQRVLDDLADM